MNTKDAFPAVAAATPLRPLIAPFAAPILIGGAIAAGLIWFFSEDETPAAEMANATPAAPKALTDSERTQRIREIETQPSPSCEERMTLTKYLALNFDSPKIGVCADVLHQVWSFWKRTPF